MTDFTKDEVIGRNITTYKKGQPPHLSSQSDHSDLTWLIGLDLTELFVPAQLSWYAAHEASNAVAAEAAADD